MFCVLCLPVSETTFETEVTTFETEEVVVVDSVIHSDVFREELQEMVAKQISDSLLPVTQPLFDLISLRQRYSQPDENRKFGTLLPSSINRS